MGFNGHTEFRRTFDLVEPIDDAVVNRLLREIRETRSWASAGAYNAITLRINCGGGDVLSAEKLAGVLLEGRPVDARVEGQCDSSALIILAACRGQRSASPTSSFVFHPVTSDNPHAAFRDSRGRFTSTSARDLLATLRQADRQIVSALANGFACDRAEIERLMSGSNGQGSLVTAKAMLARGYIQEIRPRPASPTASANRQKILEQRQRLAGLFPQLFK